MYNIRPEHGEMKASSSTYPQSFDPKPHFVKVFKSNSGLLLFIFDLFLYYNVFKVLASMLKAKYVKVANLEA